MKERIKNFFIAFLIFAGFVFIGGLMIIFLPLWLRCFIWGLMLIWLLWDVSNPDKKEKHYWLFTYIDSIDGKTTIGYGTQHTKENDFDFFLFFSKCPKGYIINIEKISKSQYEKLNEELEKRNKV